MEPIGRRPQLPALNHLEADKAKREEDAYQTRNTGMPQSLLTSATASPTHPYPHGPPPPYSHAHTAPLPAQHANTWPAIQSNGQTPPESRRASENEKESIKQSVRQSLPSLSEALGVDSQTAYSSTTAPLPPPLQQSAHSSHPQSVAPSSTSPRSRRSHPMEPPQTSSATFLSGTDLSHYSQQRSEHLPQPPQQPSLLPIEVSRPPTAYPPAPEPKSPRNLGTSLPPSRTAHATPFSRPQDPSPTHEQPSHTAGPMGPPSSFPYGYAPYPPRYVNPTPPSSVSAGPIYQPSTVYSAPQPSSTDWKHENSSRYEDRQSSQVNHGDNVKRHLDHYDLEQALNDISSTSSILTDFSRRYGDRMHQTQRSGLSLSTLPGVAEVDDMVSKSRVQLDSLLRIRDVVFAQQAIYEQQVADQRQNKEVSEAAQLQRGSHHAEAEDGKPGGFASGDTKKRRGRAAPPGRCHSCNRAETPEWRRGPDGARTLCNACGLHYAKLTRKNNGANKNTPISSSNLRPKENVAQ